jgi:hypothetical protein
MNTISLYPAVIRRACAVVAAVGWFALSPAALGDIAPDPLSGGVNFTGTTDQVRMQEESVTLTISTKRCATHALFLMKNLTDQDVTMRVGFPFSYPDDLREFKVKVDGKEIEDVDEALFKGRKDWKVWTMTFPAGTLTKVEVDYWNVPRSLSGWWSWWKVGSESLPGVVLGNTPYSRKPKGEATEAEQRQHDDLEQRLWHADLSYILETGAGWAGTIGKCRVEAKFEGFTTDCLITKFPKGNKEIKSYRPPEIEMEKLVWVLDDFEPSTNIHFQISPYITRQELRKFIEVRLREQPHHPDLTLVLGDYCDSPEEKQQQERRIDEMLAAWSTRFAVEGPDYVDRREASLSIHVWFTVCSLTTKSRTPEQLEEDRKKKLLPYIKAIAERMQAQLQHRSEHLNDYQVRSFWKESKEVLRWVEEQKP